MAISLASHKRSFVTVPAHLTQQSNHSSHSLIADHFFSLGLSGLAVAFLLRRAGHSVIVVDKQTSFDAPSAGLHVPPNLSQILIEWIGEPAFSQIAVKVSKTKHFQCEC